MNTSPSRRSRSTESEVVFNTAISSPPLASRDSESRADHILRLVRGNAFLLERVAIANGYGAILHRLSVDGDAIRRSDLILAAISAANRSRLVVENRKCKPQLLRQ